MTAEEITQYLTELNDELRLMDIKGEVSLYGGTIIENYYPKGQIPVKTQYFIEGLFDL